MPPWEWFYLLRKFEHYIRGLANEYLILHYGYLECACLKVAKHENYSVDITFSSFTHYSICTELCRLDSCADCQWPLFDKCYLNVTMR